MLAARLRADGSLDPGFGDAGVFVSTFEAGAESVAVQSDGKLVATGHTSGEHDPPATVPSAVVARLLPDGTLDASFAPGGAPRRWSGGVGSRVGAIGVALVPSTLDVRASSVVGRTPSRW